MRNIDWEAIEINWGGEKLEVPHIVKDLYENDIVSYPSAKELFTAFKKCKFNKVRVVIIGQDPYPGKGEADGMAFSMKRLKKKNNPKNSIEHYIIPRLKNVYQEGKYSDDCGDLSNWAKQGVLLLNSALSYVVPLGVIEEEKEKAEKELNRVIEKLDKSEKKKLKQKEALKKSNKQTIRYQEAKRKDDDANKEIRRFKKIIKEKKDVIDDLEKKIKQYKLPFAQIEGNPWEKLISKVLVKINEISDRKICFLLWGGDAVKIFNNAVEKPNHIVLTCAHPSPKAEGANFPFSENHHFTTVNMIQKLQKKREINWSIPRPKEKK